MAGYSPLAAEFCNDCKVPKATHEHSGHPGEQHGTGLKTRKVIHTANAREHGDNAQNHAGGTANSAYPEQQF